MKVVLTLGTQRFVVGRDLCPSEAGEFVQGLISLLGEDISQLDEQPHSDGKSLYLVAIPCNVEVSVATDNKIKEAGR